MSIYHGFYSLRSRSWFPFSLWCYRSFFVCSSSLGCCLGRFSVGAGAYVKFSTVGRNTAHGIEAWKQKSVWLCCKMHGINPLILMHLLIHFPLALELLIHFYTVGQNVFACFDVHLPLFILYLRCETSQPHLYFSKPMIGGLHSSHDSPRSSASAVHMGQIQRWRLPTDRSTRTFPRDMPG